MRPCAQINRYIIKYTSHIVGRQHGRICSDSSTPTASKDVPPRHIKGWYVRNTSFDVPSSVSCSTDMSYFSLLPAFSCCVTYRALWDPWQNFLILSYALTSTPPFEDGAKPSHGSVERGGLALAIQLCIWSVHWHRLAVLYTFTCFGKSGHTNQQRLRITALSHSYI